jgi:hypothetical protein
VRAELRRPRADPAEALDRNPQDDSRRRIAHGRERDVGPEIHVGEPLQELRCAARREPRVPVDDEVLLEAGRLDLGAFDRERYTGVARDVPQLALIRIQVSGDDLVAVEPTQTQETCGDPSAFSVTRCASESDSISARALSGSFMRRSLPDPSRTPAPSPS